MTGAFTESIVEGAALAWPEALGYAVLHGHEIAVGMFGAECSDPNYRDVVTKTIIYGKLWVSDAECQVEKAA